MAASPNFSHVLPTVFDNPLGYEPERFAPPREEDRKKPFSFIGFGGGRHACIGQNFAYLQVWGQQSRGATRGSRSAPPRAAALAACERRPPTRPSLPPAHPPAFPPPPPRPLTTRPPARSPPAHPPDQGDLERPAALL